MANLILCFIVVGMMVLAGLTLLYKYLHVYEEANRKNNIDKRRIDWQD